ncbi:MAG TPA: histidinol-phosphate transaminase [Thermotogota bacterium]|mgnify:CR=1 FL=1|nr:histidinol-phosphate transaminase [Thermotogota bacterium]
MRFSKMAHQMEPYRTHQGEASIWLNANESPLDIPPEWKKEWLQAALDIPFHRYPEIDGISLRSKLAQHLGVPPHCIILGNGSDALLSEVIRLFEGDHVLTFPPTFSMYDFYARSQGVENRAFPLQEHYQLPLRNGELPGYTGWDSCRVAFVCSPNNPTGNVQPPEAIQELLHKHIPVVVDEAYVEFSTQRILGLQQRFPNLILLRTFSKAFGLGGLRVGYAIVSEEVASFWNRITSPFSVNALSLFFAQKMLENAPRVQQNVQRIITQRDRLVKRFQEHAAPSQANFVLFSLDAFSFLRERGIVVRAFDGSLSGHFRVTVGTEQEMDVFSDALHRFIAQGGT